MISPPPTKVALIAALEREVAPLIESSHRITRTHESRTFTFYENEGTVVTCGGIGFEAARRASEAVIALYHPALLHSIGFAGALDPDLNVGDIFAPSTVIDARDASRTDLAGGNGILLTFMSVAGAQQKRNLAQSYSAQAIDMEAAAVAAAARAHGIPFTATKVISDGLDFEMPETVRFIDARGRFKTVNFAAFVALRPWLWPRVAKLASNSNKAAKSLCEHLKDFHHTYTDIAEAKVR
jgi:adenosylhomocysteine nucleosidase